MISGYKVKKIEEVVMELEERLNKAYQFLNEQSLDALYISSFDENLSEYVPKEDCHRFYMTGFSGSVAEVLIIIKNQTCIARLYVDGRYHLQADNETDSNFVEVVKCPYGQSLTEAMIEDVKKLNIKTIGLEGARCSLRLENLFKSYCKVKAYDGDEIKNIILPQ